MSPRGFRSSAALLLGGIATSFAPLEAQGTPWLLLDLEMQTTNAPCAPRIAQDAAAAGGVALFSVCAYPGGNQLWRSDGTAAGTQPLRDLDPLFAGRQPREMVFAGGRTFFNAGVDSQGDKLWCSDGTPAGTQQLADLVAGAWR